MDPAAIRMKFGDDYCADERAFIMGIDRRFTSHFASRFKGMVVLETCTGAGFSTIALARAAMKVYTVDVDANIQNMARANIDKAGLTEKVAFISGSIMDHEVTDMLPKVDAAFLDPDWNISGDDHVHRFIRSTTAPPADQLLLKVFNITENVALVLPPQIPAEELRHLPGHERQSLYMGNSHELLCLYFGDLARSHSPTEFRVP